MLKKTYALKEA